MAAALETYNERRGCLEGYDPAAADFRGWSKQKAQMYAEPQRNDFGDFVRNKGFKLD